MYKKQTVQRKDLQEICSRCIQLKPNVRNRSFIVQLSYDL